jgi:AcrR family transcriptional regulator
MIETQDTEQKILEAARKIFLEKGLSGARMQDIANEAGINKALLHYYYRSKDKLFEIVFIEHKQKMFENMSKILGSDKSVSEIIELVIEQEQDSLREMPMMPLFIMNEIHKRPEKLAEIHNFYMKDASKKFFETVKKEVAEGKIKPINPLDLLMNLVSLNVFPYLACPMFMQVLDMTQEDVDAFLENRRHTIKEFIMNAIKP